MGTLVVGILSFCAVAALVAALGGLFGEFGESRAEDRLRQLATTCTGELEEISLLKDELPTDSYVSRLLASLVRQLKLAPLLEQAGFENASRIFFGITLVTAGGGLALGLATHVPAPILPLSVLGGAVIPMVVVLMIRVRRLKHFARQLPGALEMIARALRSGNSLTAAMQFVADDTLPPLSSEFSQCCRAVSLGTPVEVALGQMEDRIPNYDLGFFVTSVTMQRQMGGNLSEICEKIAHIVKDRFRMLGQVQALTGEGRISGSVLMGLPVVVFFAMYHLSPEYVSLLFSDPVGRKMLAIAAGLQIVGAILIRKIVSIRV